MIWFLAGFVGTSLVIIVCFFLTPKVRQRQVVEVIRRLRYGKDEVEATSE